MRKFLFLWHALIFIAAVSYVIPSIGKERHVQTSGYDSRAIRNAKNSGINQALALNAHNKIVYNKKTKELLEIVYLVRHAADIELDRAGKILMSNPWIGSAFASQLSNLINVKRTTGEIIRWFSKRKPTSSTEKILYLSALLEKEKDSAKSSDYLNSISTIWSTNVLSKDVENHIRKRFAQKFPVTALQNKINLLFWHNANKEQISQLINLLPKQKRHFYDVRFKATSSPELLIKSAAKSNDDFTLYSYAKWLLKNNKDNDAAKILLSIKITQINGAAVWKLKNIAIRNALRDKKYKQALNLTTNNKGLSGADAVESYWLAGFISLSFTNQAKESIDYFKKMLSYAQFGHSKSQAAYWLGRAFAAIGDSHNSQLWFQHAITNFPFFFYGQMSVLELPGGIHSKLYDAQPTPTVKKLSYPIEVKELLLMAKVMFSSGFKSEAHTILKYMASQHLLSMDDAEGAINQYNKDNLHPLSVMFSKYLSNYGYPIIPESYPLHLNDKIKNNDHNIAFYLAIIRQESSFDQEVVSQAGAVGLMQLMPGTAHRYATKLGLHKKSYVTDIKSNLAKGSACLDDLMRQWNNNRVLAIASYNAGERAVARWVDIYGDPREMKSFYEILKWIELVPYLETRFYIKKVIENMINYETLAFQDMVEDHEILEFFGISNVSNN